MPQPLPPPGTIRKAIVASVILTVAGIALAFVPALRVAGIALAVIFAGFALLGMRNLRLATRPVVHVPPPADDARMFAVLESLGIPLSFGATDPATALRSGAAKAAIYRGFELRVAGKFDEAIAAWQSAINITDDENVIAVARDLIARTEDTRSR